MAIDLRSLDIDPLEVITLSDGKKLELYRLTNVKIIQIAKFLAIDGFQIYYKFKETLEDPNIPEIEKVSLFLGELKEEQIIHLLSILLDISDEEALLLDPFDTVEIISVFVEKTNVEQAFTTVRNLIKRFRKQPQMVQVTDKN